jgi:hypothetical protein
MSFYNIISNVTNKLWSWNSPVTQTIKPILNTDDFEFINPADKREINISGSEVDLSNVQNIAGFSQEKLLKMCNFSKLTYSNDEEKLKNTGYKTVKDFEDEGYIAKDFNNSEGYAGTLFFKNNEVILAYRGTKTLGNLVTDINCIFATSSFINKGRVHCGFYRSFQDSWDNIYKEINNYAKSQNLKVEDLNVNVTGHSMGGAVAKIAALRLYNVAGVRNINVATFGDPRAFDIIASQSYNEALGDRTIRVTQHRVDPVPAVAPGCGGYSHVGAQLRVDSMITQGNIPHKIDGYYNAIKNLKKEEYISNNTVSFFYYPSKLLQYANSYTIGVAQTAIGNLRRCYTGSSTWVEKTLEAEDRIATVNAACK